MLTVEIVIGCAVGPLIAAGLPGFTTLPRPTTSVITGGARDDEDLPTILAMLIRCGLDVLDARWVGPARPAGPGTTQINPI